jgi:hypothetical protein
VTKTPETDYIRIGTCSYSKIADRAEIINPDGKITDKFWIGFDDPCSVKINIDNYESGIYRVVFYDYKSNPVFEQKIIIE